MVEKSIGRAARSAPNFSKSGERGEDTPGQSPPTHSPHPCLFPLPLSQRTCSIPKDRRLSIRSIHGRTSRSIATSTADASALSGDVTSVATGIAAGAPLPLASPADANRPPFTIAVAPEAPVMPTSGLGSSMVPMRTGREWGRPVASVNVGSTRQEGARQQTAIDAVPAVCVG